MTISYLVFDAMFFLGPIVALERIYRPLSRERLGVVGLFVVLTVVYATPWDNYLVARGVWTYGSGVVFDRIGYVPLGEYAIFVLQPLLLGVWFYHLNPEIDAHAQTAPFPARPVGSGVWFAIAFVGGALLAHTAGYYLGAILLWAAPILGLEWAFGGPALWRYRRLQVSALTVPTVYLWVIDAIAIQWGVWKVSETTTLGIGLGGIPIEEAVFFLLTNLLLVHAFVLIHWVYARHANGDHPSYL